VLIRQAKVEDAAAFIALFDQINSETTFMLFDRGESPRTVQQQSRIFEEWAKTDSGVMFVCEENRQLVGFVAGRRGVGRRQAHSIYIVMGVLQAWVGRGIGRSLLEALEGWAQSKGLHRLELIVNSNNERAIRLYNKFGFEREGVKRHAFSIDGHYIDAFYMAKLIGN
jgi:RimJ/RimL family protein N-acetyltransferase